MSHQLILVGEDTSDEFTSEVHNAEDPNALPQPCFNALPAHFGDIQFTDSNQCNTYLEYTGLQPIYDIVASAKYTFNDYGSPDQSFTAVNGGPFLTASQGVVFASTPIVPGTPLFETTYIANKGDVVFNTPTCYTTSPLVGLVNIPDPSDGLYSLKFNVTDNGPDIVSFINVPFIGGDTQFLDGPGNDTTNVSGDGIPLGAQLFANGGAGINTLVYDADGMTPTIQPDGVGGMLISIPGFGTVSMRSTTRRSTSSMAPKLRSSPACPGRSTRSKASRSSTPSRARLPRSAPVIIIPTPPSDDAVPSPSPASLPASDFVATIDWGDPSPDDRPARSSRTPAIRACTTSPARTPSPRTGRTRSTTRSASWVDRTHTPTPPWCRASP